MTTIQPNAVPCPKRESSLLEWSDDFSQAFDLMENTNNSLFVTGNAGTGKSTLLQVFRERTEKNVVVLAPTGVAAVNIKGQTIHSFFRFKPDMTPENVASIKVGRKMKQLYKSMDTLVIDEISMVRADLLDCVDRFLRLHGANARAPFGGVQLIAIGDLYQLPPVVPYSEQDIFRSHYRSPYFFDAHVFGLGPERWGSFHLKTVELKKIYRQKDDRFIALLNAVRNNVVTPDQWHLLNSRVEPTIQPQAKDFFIYLTTRNDRADAINEQRVRALPGDARVYEGQIYGDFDPRNLPTNAVLELKEGAQVMLLNNHPKGLWVNGTIGVIDAIESRRGEPDAIDVRLEDGSIVRVEPHTWDMFRTRLNSETGRLESELIGSFTQVPLRLAWAVTIHKSQGKTFSRVIVDIGSGAFSHGQVYVALSRCVSLEGLVLVKPILRQHIFIDPRVRSYMAHLQQTNSTVSDGLDHGSYEIFG